MMAAASPPMTYIVPLDICDRLQPRIGHYGNGRGPAEVPRYIANSQTRRASCPPPSVRSTSLCSAPLVHTTLPPSGPGTPFRSVNSPPASSMMTCSAARSHSETSGSVEMSMTPSATMTCDQKSPYARVRQTARVRSSRLPSRPCSSQPLRLEYDSDASARVVTDETWQRVALARLRPVQEPPSRAAHQRRLSDGAETTPTTTPSYSIRAISVAQTGTPRTKFLVASIGSITQHRAPWPVLPYSSPSTASRGRARLSVPRIDSSTARSASLTGVRSGLVSTRKSSARNRRVVMSSPASASTCARRRSSVYPATGRHATAITTSAYRPGGGTAQHVASGDAATPGRAGGWFVPIGHLR